jgi:hypothetical protein
MATKIGKRITRAVTKALLERDRAEMRAVDALLSLVESPRRKRRRANVLRHRIATGRVRVRASRRISRRRR